MDEQLTRRSVGAPAARSLLLTVLGEYVLARPGGLSGRRRSSLLWSRSATRQQAARQAVARSTRDGWLATERRGRRARMSLADRTAALLRPAPSASTRSARPWDWDGRWLLLVLRVPEERREVRHQLRSRLAWAGLGSLGGGVWLTPHVEREDGAGRCDQRRAGGRCDRSFVARLGSHGRARAVVRRTPGISTAFGSSTWRSSMTSPEHGRYA